MCELIVCVVPMFDVVVVLQYVCVLCVMYVMLLVCVDACARLCPISVLFAYGVVKYVVG